MKKFKIIGYVTIGFEKIIECESFEEAEEQANVIALTEDVDGRDMNEWFDSVEVEEVEELEEQPCQSKMKQNIAGQTAKQQESHKTVLKMP